MAVSGNIRYIPLSNVDSDRIVRVELETVPEDAPLPVYTPTSRLKLPAYEETKYDRVIESNAVPAYEVQAQAAVCDYVLGDDVSFICTFLVSFFLNWVGYLLCFCMSTSIAARSGALSGFGLALVKVTFLLKHFHDIHRSDEGHIVKTSDGQEYRVPIISLWLLALFFIVGMFCFLQGIVTYYRAKAAYRRSFA
eukprot:m.64494 g.64494  ORF g.64494 m.64494 type:complete len:194 (+) comp13928_c0_seq1:254-835(+)